MPYIITTTTPSGWRSPDTFDGVTRTTRRAVATLEEAQRHPEHEGWDSARCENCGHFEAEHESGWCAGCDNGGRDEPDICRTWKSSEIALMFKTLPESGGTVGAFPDGTVIEVTHV